MSSKHERDSIFDLNSLSLKSISPNIEQMLIWAPILLPRL
ncbi:hypothetical protein GCHA_1610 [Paraglaciecola chathamensis S18K6]|uniref:Uncharacterized protein n=1 Tax=Paraglaciecola chathamensis S18K6 TaxID=1127672 RepID=A0AAV3UWA8_9ALTE|nr:hypothetical protein GCHA_1610 [Paraglaciecola chathamensis S18K6]